MEVIGVSEKLVGLLRDDEVSKSFLYTFRETFTKLVEVKDDFPTELEELVEPEFMRIMQRAHSTKETKDEVSQETVDSIAKLIYDVQPFSDFLDYLETINFIARESK